MANKAFSLLLSFFLVAVAVESLAADVIVRKVPGTVVATETTTVPNTIVVKTVNHKGQDLIIGAAVLNDTVITKGGMTISLWDVADGDRVVIVYERNKRVVAKSITVR